MTGKICFLSKYNIISPEAILLCLEARGFYGYKRKLSGHTPAVTYSLTIRIKMAFEEIEH